MIANAVLHMNNEQPLVADLFEMPGPDDVTLRCTNLRTLNGKRPVWADDQDSVFVFPWAIIRFLEILPTSMAADGTPRVAIGAGVRPGTGPDGPDSAAVEPDLEIDEDFLRRIREV